MRHRTNTVARLGLAVLCLCAAAVALGGAAPTNALKAGDPAPLFKLPAAQGGKDVALYQQKGKVVLLDFFATWCKPCQAELPSFQKAYEKYKDSPDVVLYVVSIDKTRADVLQFLKAHSGYTMPVLYDNNQQVALRYGAVNIPVFVAVGKDGKIGRIVRGEMEDVEKTVDEIVAELGGAAPKE